MRTGKLPHVKSVSAKGRRYEYFDTGVVVNGKPVRKRLPPRGDPTFGSIYAALLGARSKRAGVAAVLKLPDFISDYERSLEYGQLRPSTQRTYSIYLRLVADQLAAAPAAELERSMVLKLRDRVADGDPRLFGGKAGRGGSGAANALVRAIGALYAWGRKRGILDAEPCKDVGLFRTRDYQPWPAELLDAALACGERDIALPVALLYFTAQRIGDVCAMSWNDVRDGVMNVVQEKTGKTLWIAIHRDLRRVLADAPRHGLTILAEADSRPISDDALRRRLQRFASDRGYKIVPHGLRKNAVNSLLEAGCSVAETAAVSGQSLQLVEHYAKQRDDRKLNSAAILKWEGGRT